MTTHLRPPVPEATPKPQDGDTVHARRKSDEILRAASKHGVTSRLQPDLRPVEAAVQRILQRWPDVIADAEPKDSAVVLRKILTCLSSNNWSGVKVRHVTVAARAAFSPEFRHIGEFAPVRDFLVEQTRVSGQTTLITAMVQVYIESFGPNADHTRALAAALRQNRANIGARLRDLVEAVPRLLEPDAVVEHLSSAMQRMDSPWQGLKALGFTNPHAPGLLDHVHLAYVRRLAPSLTSRETVDCLLDWLKPDSHPAKKYGVTHVIEALLSPWLSTPCPEDLKKYLTERLLQLFGDLRTKRTGDWAQVSQRHRDLILRWLTYADMLFFINVVDETQPSPQWQKRRNLWLRLYEQGRIDGAWVAFSDDAVDYANRKLPKERGVGLETRFGRQNAQARKHTSLLVMKIGSKTVVDGCHNYKTHIFDAQNRSAPTLYERTYDCDAIRKVSSTSKSHSSIDRWENWVLENI